MLSPSNDIFGILFGIFFGVAAVFALCYFFADKDPEGQLFKNYMKMKSAALNENADLDTIKGHITDMLSLLDKFLTDDDGQKKDLSAFTAYLQAISKMENISDMQINLENLSLPQWMVIYPKGKDPSVGLRRFFLAMIILFLVAAAVTFIVWVIALHHSYEMYHDFYWNGISFDSYISPSECCNFWNLL